MIPPRKVKIPERKSNVDLVIHCSKCGHGKIFKGVAGLDYNNLCNLRELLNVVGWQNMPRVLCRSCGCPMDADEFLLYKKTSIEEMPAFRKSMHEKYGWKIERFFATTE